MSSHPQHVIYGIVQVDETLGCPRVFVGDVLVKSWHSGNSKSVTEAIQLAESLSKVIELEKIGIKNEMERQFRGAADQIKLALGVYAQ